MYIEEDLILKVFTCLSNRRPVIIAGRYSETRDMLVNQVFSHYVAEEGGDITSSHSHNGVFHNCLLCKDHETNKLEAYFDCNVVLDVEDWKKIAKNKTSCKMLSCQLNSLGVLSRAFVDCLYDSFNTFTLITVDEVDDKVSIDIMNFG